MMGRREGGQGQFFYEFNLDEVVPAEHLVRRIDAVLDLGWVSIGASHSPLIEVHPREWTGSGCGFAHLPGVLLFEPDGAPIAERGMEPLAL